MRSFWSSALVACALLWPALAALAQDASAITPPSLETFVPAESQADVKGVTLPAAVDLLLTIDETGHVSDAVVEHGLHPAFDEAAVAAARRFVFQPAKQGDKPFAARVRYRFLFAAPAPVEELHMQTGDITGRLEELPNRTPIAGATVTLTLPDGTTQEVVSDRQGAFSFLELTPGEYAMTMRSPRHTTASASVSVQANERIEASYGLALIQTKSEPEAEFGAVGQVKAVAHELVKRSIAREELTRMAGTRGDPLRAIELLPGVARPPSGEGMVLVRGSSPGDSQVFLGGAPIQNLYHFGGLTSVVNGFLLSGIDLYPGNFSVRYGRKIGAVIDTNLRDPKSDRFHGLLDVNMIDASLLVEAPIRDDLSIAVAARRSHFDAWYSKVAESAELAVQSAPVYYDYQAILAWRPSPRDKLRLVGYGSYDTMKLDLNEADEHDPAVHGRFSDSNSYHRAQLEWQHTWSERVNSDTLVAVGPLHLRRSLGNAFGYDVEGIDMLTRSELHVALSSRLKLNLGLDVQLLRARLRYQGPRLQQQEGDPSSAAPLTGRELGELDTERTYARPALYTELVAQVTDELELTGGLRVDYFSDVKALAFDPRLNAKLMLGSTTLRAGVGQFTQPPEYVETVAGYGDPDIDPVKAIHYGVGVEQAFSTYGSVSLDGFYKSLSNLIVNGSQPGDLSNRGDGRIYGLELMGRMQPLGRLSGFLAYTLSRSERNDHDGTGYRLFDYDQTHILTASANLKLGCGFLLGSTFRLGTGNPNTPIVGALYDASLDVYQPLYGSVNSDRDATFHRLDVRIEKRWEIGRGAITSYLDVQNVYNRQNPEGVSYNFDYSRSKTTAGMPIIPSLGIRGEL